MYRITNQLLSFKLCDPSLAHIILRDCERCIRPFGYHASYNSFNLTFRDLPECLIPHNIRSIRSSTSHIAGYIRNQLQWFG